MDASWGLMDVSWCLLVHLGGILEASWASKIHGPRPRWWGRNAPSLGFLRIILYVYPQYILRKRRLGRIRAGKENEQEVRVNRLRTPCAGTRPGAAESFCCSFFPSSFLSVCSHLFLVHMFLDPVRKLIESIESTCRTNVDTCRKPREKTHRQEH